MRRSLAFIRFIIEIAALGAGLAAGCSRDRQSTTASSSPRGGNPWSGHEAVAKYAAEHGKTVYQVTYQPETVFFDQASTERALQDISADGATYTLDASVPAAKQLKAGSVLFLYGVAIRKVTAVRTEGPNVIATTSDGDLTDAIKDGHIEWQIPIDYAAAGVPPQAARSRGFEEFFVAPVLAAGPVNWMPKVSFGEPADNFKCDFTFGYNASRVDIDMHGTYTGSEAIIELHGKGYVQTAMATGTIDISGGLIDTFNAGLSGMEGHVDFDWSAQLKTSMVTRAAVNRDFKIKLPGLDELQWPFLVGPVPFEVGVSWAFIVHPAFTSSNATASGQFSVDYSGSTGVTVGTSPPQPQGEMHGNASIGHGTDATSASAMSFTAALELPRLELSLALIPRRFTALSDTLKAQKVGAGLFGKHWLNEEVQAAKEAVLPFALPVKPYAFVNLVTSTGIFTNGQLVPSLVALPPCARAQITETVNGGVGVKINLRNGGKIFKQFLQPSFAPKLQYAVSSPSLTYTFKAWKNHIKCPDDE